MRIFLVMVFLLCGCECWFTDDPMAARICQCREAAQYQKRPETVFNNCLAQVVKK